MVLDLVAKKKKRKPQNHKKQRCFLLVDSWDCRVVPGSAQFTGGVLAPGSALAGKADYSFHILESNSAQPLFALTSCQKS